MLRILFFILFFLKCYTLLNECNANAYLPHSKAQQQNKLERYFAQKLRLQQNLFDVFQHNDAEDQVEDSKNELLPRISCSHSVISDFLNNFIAFETQPVYYPVLQYAPLQHNIYISQLLIGLFFSKHAFW